MFKCTYLKVAVSGQKQANKHTHVCDAFSLVLSKNKIGIIVIWSAQSSFIADLIEFLKKAEKELDKTFNSNCAFAEIYQVLIRHSGDMRATVEQMRGKARELCGSPLMQCIEESKNSIDYAC